MTDSVLSDTAASQPSSIELVSWCSSYLQRHDRADMWPCYARNTK